MRVIRVLGTSLTRIDEHILVKHLLELSRPEENGTTRLVGIKNPAGVIALEVHTFGYAEYESCCRFWVYLGYVRCPAENTIYAAVFERELW